MSGKGIIILFSNLLLMAGSKPQGIFVAPKTNIPSMSFPTPYIYVRNSVFTLLLDSFSPSDLLLAIESISSIKIILGFLLLAILNKHLINFSDSPTYFDIKSDELIEKNVASHSVAQAFAMKVLPVPGGPYSKIPLQGFRFFLFKKIGKFKRHYNGFV